MPEARDIGAMPYYPHLVTWVKAEVAGLTDAQLDFHDQHPDREWMWWSIRRQVSHMAWDALVFPYRRCAPLLWPDADPPEPIVWKDHRRGPERKHDRMLDAALFWQMPDLLEKLELGISWLERVVTEQSIETLRATMKSVRGTNFWRYVIQTLPRGAEVDPDREGYIRYDLEGSLWMVFYEILSHIRTIQRLKHHQHLALAVALPRVGYLRLPEYWGETDRNGPDVQRY
jgi:hypothetical protein